MIEDVKSRSRVAWMTVSQSVPLSVEDGVVVAAVSDAGAVTHFRKTAYPALVGEALLAVLRTDLTFELVLDPGRSAAGAATGTVAGPAGGSGPRPATTPQPTAPGAPSAAATRTTATDAPPPPDAPPEPPPMDDENVEDSLDAVAQLRGVALIEAELGGEKIDEYEE